MKKTIMLSSLILMILIVGCKQSAQKTDTQSESFMEEKWEPLKSFIGTWVGNEGGGPEQGKGERHYRPIIQDKYLYFTNRSVFEPSERRPEGEIHEDWGIFSFDQGNENFVLRQFDTDVQLAEVTLNLAGKMNIETIFRD